MSNLPLYAPLLVESFNKLPQELRDTTIKRIKEINGVPEDADISENIATYLVQDMLFSVVDDAFKTNHVLTELCENGVPNEFVEQHNLNEDQVVGFMNGARFAHNVYKNIMMNSTVVSTLMDTMEKVSEEAEEE